MTRVAIVHDWLTGMRGGEYVLEAILELFPDAELFTLIHSKGKLSPAIESRRIHTSFLQGIPGIEKRYRHCLPLMPSAIERFDLKGFDLIVSSSHCVAKGVRKDPGAVHVSYIHAPMRYIWDRFEDYFGPGRASPHVRVAARMARPLLRAWDRRASQPDRVDLLVANSRFIAGKIREAYGRDAEVVHPFADLSRFQAEREPGAEYLMVGAFAPNKRVDLAVEAFNRLKLPLAIVGEGQEEGALRRLAGPTVRFLGPVSNREIPALFARAKAFVFPGLEDFGITPVEAMAAGCPVIAYGEGGAAETVTSETGTFFRPQTVEALVDALEKFERGEATISEEACRARAASFTRERFKRELRSLIDRAVATAASSRAD